MANRVRLRMEFRIREAIVIQGVGNREKRVGNKEKGTGI